MRNFIITSNISLLFPLWASFFMREWIYFAFVAGLCISSPLYHYLKEHHSSKPHLFKNARALDWIIAGGAYAMMYFYIFTKVDSTFRIPLFIALSLSLIFFWYGYKIGNYRKLHPWFHLTAPIVSGLIVLSFI